VPRKQPAISRAKLATRKKASGRLALLALGFLIGLLILGKLISVLAALQKPLSSDILTHKKYTWDSHTSINLVVKSKTISVVNYDPVNKKIIILSIPDDAYFSLPHDLGSWRVSSIYDLGQEENPPQGAQLLKDSLSQLLGLPIDGYVMVSGSDQDKPVNQLISSLKNPFAVIGFVHQIKTDLTPLEAFNLFKAMAGTRADKITMLDTKDSAITQSELLPDSSRVLGIDNVQMDLFIRDKMSDMQIGQEGKSIAIFNATSHPGLAAMASREITNMGGNVIFTASTDNLLQQSLVTSSDKSTTWERLSQVFAPQCLNTKCASADPKISSSRAEINVILGEDYYQGL